jgi:sulfhydrogenase subunit gamma (sulfur reductase)
MIQRVVIPESEYNIRKARVVRVRRLTPQERFFEIKLNDGSSLNHDPGQFVEVSLFGVGEAPISLASSPTQRGTFDLCVRNVGRVTAALHRLETGDELGIRGPFGKGFPVRNLEGNDLLLIAGGLGIVPLRSLIHYVMDNRREFGQVHILLGCKNPQSMLFSDEIEAWGRRLDVEFLCTVDRADPDWKGNVGLITALIPGIDLRPQHTYAVVVGPPVMYKFVLKELLAKQVPEDRIVVSLERHMKCGLGKCGHCQINRFYCCQDGPVFFYDQIKSLEEAFTG